MLMIKQMCDKAITRSFFSVFDFGFKKLFNKKLAFPPL